MPLLFTQLCDLLSALEDLATRDPPPLPARHRQQLNETIKSWFASHRVTINSPEIDIVALLSALFPARRTDRVYGIQPPKLTKILKRCLSLGKTRWPHLDQWQQAGRGDLGDCVERVLEVAEFPLQHGRNRVTLEQVDQSLATVAARCRFSAPKIRARELENDVEIITTLEMIYKRMQSREAKWLTRIILKEYPCLGYTENMVYYHIDLRLRVAMQMFDHFEAAVSELRALPASQMADTGQGGWTQHCADDAHLLPPRVGTKIGPPKWIKAKGGVKHALAVINKRTMSVERKHDGEYCQIHVDLSQGNDCLQIFSKSGKDSTLDRRDVHQAIKDSLRIGQDDCGFSAKCILEGELLVSSERADDVLEFYKIRKHVSRSGSFLGTGLDSQPNDWEHLMIMFYDVLLVDNDPVLHRPHKERRRLLKDLVTPIKWRAGLAWHQEIDFSTANGPKRLKKALAFAFVQRWEGLVLKPSEESYFDMTKPVKGRYPSRWIKLKKDCISGLGDTADFAVIGGGYDVKEASRFPGLKLTWTRFYIGCLCNKEHVLGLGDKPKFLVFDTVSDCIKKDDLVYLNQHGHFPTRAAVPESDDESAVFDVEYAMGISKPLTTFKEPFVFDIAGSGFDKSPNRDIFTLRFPRVMKVHRDRDWKQAVSLEELQRMATTAMTAPSKDLLSEEVRTWIAKLDKLDRGAKGQTPPWDYTDDEEEDYVWGVSVSPKHQSHRARTPAPPPLVCMDTGEMHDRERRTSSGEIVERLSSKHSTLSNTSGGFLHTPSTSSSLSKDGGNSPKQFHRANTDGWTCTRTRKRSAEAASTIEESRDSKKARQQLHQSNPELNPHAGQKRPLCEIKNSARSRLQPQSAKPPQTSPDIFSKDLHFVRKVMVGSDEHMNRVQKKRRIIMDPSSPARETTASLSTTATTTQHSSVHDVAINASPSPAQRMAKNAQLVTPPSTAEQRGLRKQVQRLQECDLVLSPCIAVGSHPLKEILAKHSILYRCLSDITQSSSPALITDTSNTNATYVLVDSDSTRLSGKLMWSVVPQALHLHPRSVTVWDWKFVESMLENEIGDGEAQKRQVEKHLVAQLSWNSDLKIVEVHWENGTVSRVTQAELSNFQVIDPAVDGALVSSQ